MTFSFWVFYALCLLPLAVGGALLIFNKEVNIAEYAIGSGLALVVAVIMHLTAVNGMTSDVETWSGQIQSARQYSAWQEYYEEAIYRTEVYTTTSTDSKGHMTTSVHTRQVFDHWEPRRRWHDEHFGSSSNIGTSYPIGKDFFTYFTKVFKDRHAVGGTRTTGEHNSRMIAGDPNDYVGDNHTGHIEPITDLRNFENRIKGAPSTFSFLKPPENVKTFAYPANNDPWKSDRLLGSAALLNLFVFDQMNARLGPSNKVNVIMVGMGNVDSFYAQWQEAAWLRGKKNDIVICWGGLNAKPSWVKVFSWGEGPALKAIETTLLDKGVSEAIFPEIEQNIRTGFTRADFKKFDYISIEIPVRYVYWYILFMAVTQVAFYYFALHNVWDKLGDKTYRRWSNSYSYDR